MQIWQKHKHKPILQLQPPINKTLLFVYQTKNNPTNFKPNKTNKQFSDSYFRFNSIQNSVTHFTFVLFILFVYIFGHTKMETQKRWKQKRVLLVLTIIIITNNFHLFCISKACHLFSNLLNDKLNLSAAQYTYYCINKQYYRVQVWLILSPLAVLSTWKWNL